MQYNSVNKIKTELKRIRNGQNLHKSNARIIRQKVKLRTKLWKLLREQSPSKRPARES